MNWFLEGLLGALTGRTLCRLFGRSPPEPTSEQDELERRRQANEAWQRKVAEAGKRREIPRQLFIAKGSQPVTPIRKPKGAKE